MKDVVIITDPRVVRVISDHTRFKILKLLRKGPMTINELSDEIKKDRTTVYRHVKALERAGLVEEIEVQGNEKVYARSARLFLVKAEPDESVENFRKSYIQIEVERLVDILEEAGFKIKDRDRLMEMARNILNKIEISSQPAIKKISESGIELTEIELFHLLNMLVFLQSCDLCKHAKRIRELIEF